MYSVPTAMNLKDPIKTLTEYFSDPDFSAPSTDWSCHFLSSANIVFNHIKDEYELLGVKGSFKRPFVSYKHLKYKEEKSLTKNSEGQLEGLPKLGQRVHSIDFRAWELQRFINNIMQEKPF